MSQQGPVITVSTAGRPPFVAVLDNANMFPVVDVNWADAPRAIQELHPAAVLVATAPSDAPGLNLLARQTAAARCYLPLIAVASNDTDPQLLLPENALPCSPEGADFVRLIARLRAALRVRSLHATVLRRLDGNPQTSVALPDVDPVRDATVLLIGRGATYPALSVAIGERTGLVGAFSIEAAAKHLNTRDIDGIVLGEGFSLRVIDAFLTVLAEDARFRNLPVVLTTNELTPSYDLPNLEIIQGEPTRVAANALPLIRQHAFEAHLSRTLRSIDGGGLLDPRTGLLSQSAFNRDLAAAVDQTLSAGGGLSLARFAFDPSDTRSQRNGARIISRIMRQQDFGGVQQDGSIVVAFAETDLRNAHMIARRLTSVMRTTEYGRRYLQAEPRVTLATLLPSDSTRSLLARLHGEARRAAS